MRAGRVCTKCGKFWGPMEVDHVWPKSRGGPNHRLNYQTLCRRHNRRKGARYADYRLRNLLLVIMLLWLLVLIHG